MAHLLRILFFFLFAVVALSITATARPCRTFLISSTSGTATEIQSVFPLYIASFKPYFSGQESKPIRIDHHRRDSYGFYSYDFSYLLRSSNDIVSFGVGLLFGVVCALTATIMYLAWNMFVKCYEDYSSSYHHFLDYSDEKIDNPKKNGYEKIQASKEAV